MKKLIVILIIVLGLCTGCGKFMSDSDKPPIFVIQKVTQDRFEKELNVAKYKIRIFTFGSQGSPIMSEDKWFTLEEGFQVGDTLKLTK